MKIKEAIGIDISKETLDCCIHTLKLHKTFSNDEQGISQMVEWGLSAGGRGEKEEKDVVLFIFEHTGLYNHLLVRELSGMGIVFSVVPALEIKRSLGITRGKNSRSGACCFTFLPGILPTVFQLSTPWRPAISSSQSIRKRLRRGCGG